MADKPYIGQLNWGGTLNAFLDELEAAVASATNATIVSAAVVDGNLVFTLADASNLDAGTLPAGATNLSVARTGTSLTVESDTGDDAVVEAADGTNAGVMTSTMFTKLDGIASGATVNDTDANLKSRANHTGTQAASTISDLTEAVQDILGSSLAEGSHVTVDYDDGAGTVTISVAMNLDDLSDVDLSGAVAGQVLTKDADGSWKPATVTTPNSEPGSLDDLTDVATTTPTDGGLLVYSNSSGQWSGDFGLVGNLILSAGEDVPAGTPPCMVWDLPTSLIGSADFEGTPGATIAAGDEGFDSFTGAAVTYNNTQVLEGSTSFRVASGSTGYFTESGLAVSVLVLKGRVRTDGTPSGNTNIAEMRTASASVAAIQRNATSSAFILKDEAGITRATSTTTFSTDTWFVYEWQVDAGTGTQTLRIYNTAGTLLETISGSCNTGTIDLFRYGVVANTNGSFYFDKCSWSADWIGAGG